jgi:benzylsuccinate CoA-transferase BbsE subunit
VGALSGYRVLDLTDERGMLSARLLADMGAEVIRIEGPARASGSTADFAYLNAGKRSITLDLGPEPGREVFRRLVKTADVLVETFAPGYLSSLGLGYDDLGKINPRLVMASITGFGQDGPYRDYNSADIVAGALGGWLSVGGEPDMPLKPFGDQSFYTASLFAANGILLALWQRHATGLGQHVDVSVMECVAATLDHVLVRYFHGGVVVGRTGDRYWNNAFRIFPCRDGHVLLTLFMHWETLVGWLDAEGMAEDLADEKWRDGEARLRGVEHIVEVLERWTLSHTAAGLVEKGQLMRFPWAKIASILELLSSPHLKERGFFTEVACPETGGNYKSAGAPFKMSASPLEVGGRVPSPGESNVDIKLENEG